jgi:sigma-B regulation protein RsbU (phosphoserine phosphatase)
VFMLAVRTLARHPAAAGKSPAEILGQINMALAPDNRSGIFVTVLYGTYAPDTGEVVLCSGGHPSPLIRRANGRVETVPLANGALLGVTTAEIGLADYRFTLGLDEMLVVYTDGITEAQNPRTLELFGLERLQQSLAELESGEPIRACSERIYAAVDRFSGKGELQDDETILLLRRRPALSKI